jgi:hypothetical protein
MKVTITNIQQGMASVRVGVTPNSRYAGTVYRLDNGKWVPVTRGRESHANWPQFPAYRTRREAAEALASGNFNY